MAQEIACKLEQAKSFRQICRSVFQHIEICKHIKGIRISCSGRLNGAEIAKTECRKYGETSLHVFSEKIDYAQTKASTPYGLLGVKGATCPPKGGSPGGPPPLKIYCGGAGSPDNIMFPGHPHRTEGGHSMI
eukprot:jgi/Mesen1/2296/ME001545S01381